MTAGYTPTWVDLLDLRPDERVGLVGPDQHAGDEVVRRGAVLCLATAPALDVVGLTGVRPTAEALRRHAAPLVAGGRLAVLVDNALSPLRAADRLAGRPRSGRGAVGLRQVRRAVRHAGLEDPQVFGLLRSSAAPSTAFDVDCPVAASAVLGASLSHVGGLRGALTGWSAQRSPARIAALCPAWLLVARTTGGSERAGHRADDRIVGKVSNRDSEEVKLLRGSPPRLLEKLYLTAGAPREVAALRELEHVGFAPAPRLVGDPGPGSCRTTWVPGEPLLPPRLDLDDLVRWTGRAAAVLADLHRRTRHADGSVLVHGDFWLGNLVVRGDAVAAIIDWTGARRGADTVDRDFLVDSTTRLRPDVAGLRDRLEAACRTEVERARLAT